MSLAMQAKRFINADNIGDYVQVNGNDIHYVQCGRGEPLVLIHGIGQSLFTWRKVIDLLGEQYHVFALDLMGFGYSAKPQDFSYTIREYSETIKGFFDAIGIQAAHIAAFSSGAIYALDFAQQYPDRVGELILLSPGGLTSEMPFLVHMLSNNMLGQVASRLYSVRSIRNMLRECFFDLTLLDEQDVHDYYAPLSDLHARKVMNLSVKNLDETEVMQALRNVFSNALIIWGEDDKWHPVAMSEIFEAAIKSSRLALVRNCGHLIQEEKPQKLVELIHAFLQGGETPAQESN